MDNFFKKEELVEIENKLESLGLDKNIIEVWFSSQGKTLIDTDTLTEMKCLIPQEYYRIEFDL